MPIHFLANAAKIPIVLVKCNFEYYICTIVYFIFDNRAIKSFR